MQFSLQERIARQLFGPSVLSFVVQQFYMNLRFAIVVMFRLWLFQVFSFLTEIKITKS